MDRYLKSNQMLARAEKTIPLAAQTFSKSRLQFPVPCAPMFLERGQGGRVWDVDGNTYVDLICGLLPVNLGYCDPDVDAAVRQQLDKGMSFSLSTPLEYELSERLVDLIPSAEMVRFGKNGTDATSAAIRLARAFTGRDHVLALGYHGWQDWYIGATTRKLGVPETVQHLTHKLPYNDFDAVKEAVAKYKGNVAAIIMEPASGTEPKAWYLEGLRALCDEQGIVLIFDEVIMGFRIHMGGAQAYYGVTPDLSAFGKAMGNGMPISAIVGRKNIMSLMEDIFYSGTFGGEALSLAASLAVIDKMKREPVIETLWRSGQTLYDEATAIIKKHGLDTVIGFSGIAPWKTVTFKDHDRTPKEAIKTMFMLEMLKQGVLIASSHNICYAHDERDISHVVQAYDHTMGHISNALSAGTLMDDLDIDPIYPVFQVRS